MMVHIGKEIKTVMDRRKVTVTWFAQQLDCSRTNVYKIFAKDHIDTSLLLRISRIIGYNFFQSFNAQLLAEGIGCVERTKRN